MPPRRCSVSRYIQLCDIFSRTESKHHILSDIQDNRHSASNYRIIHHQLCFLTFRMPRKQPILLEQRRALRAWARKQHQKPTQKQCIEWFLQQYNHKLSQSTVSESLSPLTALTKLLIPTEHDYELETGLKSKSFFLLGNFELSRMEGLQLVIYFNKRRDKSGNAFHITTA
jgi:hypothetical protein